MTKVQFVVFLLFCCFQATFSFAQEPFRNCSAAFLDNRMVVDDYSPQGKCVLSESATGELSIYTVDLSPTETIPKEKIRFMIAIRDKNTGTLSMYSTQVHKTIDIRKLLTKCSKGDRIVLITVDTEYSVPHNEILIQ